MAIHLVHPSKPEKGAAPNQMIDRSTINGAVRRIPKWPLYLISVIPVVALFYAGATGQLGVDPIKAIEHELGELALQLFIASLCITPLCRLARINLIKFRRPLGLITFFYVLLHLLVWVVLDMSLLWGQMWADILKRPYITIGMAGFLLLIPLALTSNDWSIKKLGAAGWQRVHLLAYPAVLLGAIHNVMVQKVWEAEALIYLGIIVFLLSLRGRRLLPRVFSGAGQILGNQK